MDLHGKVALVTGGAVRLGRAMSLALAGQGVRVAVHYGHSAGPARDVVAEIAAAGGDAAAFQADFRQAYAARTVVERAAEHFGRVDILVNSAAIFERGDWDKTTEENWDRHFAINLKAPFFLSQAFAKGLGAERPGHIVNIADWRGVRPGPDRIAYTLTKAALIAMTRSLALALAPNVQVNVIAPGLVLPPEDLDEARVASKVREIPAQRAGSPQEIVNALLFLLRSDFVTGELIYVTGGKHL